MPPESPIVSVHWRDGWFDFDEPEEARDDYLVTTIGFLVKHGERFLTLAQEVLPDGDGFRALAHIPTAVVVSIDTLEESDVPNPHDMRLRGRRNGQRQGVPEMLPHAAALDPA